MANRLKLHEELKNILGSTNVYFQPPDGSSMNYPAIVYNIAKMDRRMAGDIIYSVLKAYTVTVIDENPDSEIPDKVLNMEYCKFERSFRTTGLNHYVFTLYY